MSWTSLIFSKLTKAAAVVALFCGLVGGATVALPSAEAKAATLVAKVSLQKQRMQVYVDGRRKHTWVISTGKRGWRTKPGNYWPFKMQQRFYSKRWRMSLPYLVWIGQDGTAIHGTTYASRLGRPASHGCIRLSISNAAKFYRLVQRHGMWGTRVEVTR